MFWKDRLIKEKFDQYNSLLSNYYNYKKILNQSARFAVSIRRNGSNSDHQQYAIVSAIDENDLLSYLNKFYEIDEIKELNTKEYKKLCGHHLYDEIKTSNYDNLISDMKSTKYELSNFEKIKSLFK